jgi:hypothetical protein
MSQAQLIADYNQQHFFSQNFCNLVLDELKTNLNLAINKLNQCNNYQPWIDRWQQMLSYPEITEYLKNNQHPDPDFPTIELIEQSMLVSQNQLKKIANKNKK